jgi:PAS domain S-box-containing protein
VIRREPLRFALALSAFSAFMLAYEWCKQVLWPDIPIWYSHFITIAFSTLLAGAGGRLYLLKNRRLHESEGRFSFAVESIGAGIWEWNLKTGALLTNPHFSEMLALDPGKPLPTMEAFAALMHPEDKAAFLQTARKLIKDGESFYSELRMKLGDGSWKWISMSGRRDTYSDGGRPIRAFGFCLDIDDRKKAEGEMVKQLAVKETLLKEVHHRVKNNLQVISSILSLQEASLRDDADKALSRDTQARVRSMAYLHELLYGSANYSTVDPAKYLKLIVGGVSLSHGKYMIKLRAEPDAISIDEAMPFGLIVSELLTNAIKHAYSGEDAESVVGRREITVTYGREGGQRRLEVRDEGFGLPRGLDPDASASMGFSLVRGLAEQLGGRLSMGEARPGNPRPGVTAVLVFPANSGIEI